MAKAAVHKVPAPVVVVCDSLLVVRFSREVIEEREMFRRLAHRVVEMVVDSGRHKLLRACVADGLAYIARDDLIKQVADLVHEVSAGGP